MNSIDMKFDEINKAILMVYDDIRKNREFNINPIDGLVSELGQLFVGVPLEKAMNYKDQFIATSLKIKALKKMINVEIDETSSKIKELDKSAKAQEAYASTANDNPKS